MTLELTKGMCLGLVDWRDRVLAAAADDVAVVHAVYVCLLLIREGLVL